MTTGCSQGLLAGLDVDALRARLHRPPFDRLWAELEWAWRLSAERSRATGGYFTYGTNGWHSFSPGVLEAGLAFHLTGDREALAYVEDRARHLARLETDADARQKVANGQWPIHSHVELALAADLCRDGLPPDALEALLGFFRRVAIDFHDDDRSMLYWGGGANIPLMKSLVAGIVALVWGEACGHPDWRRVVDLARQAVELFLHNGVDAGGHGFEGPGYASDSYLRIYLFAWLLRQRGIADLFATQPRLARIPAALAQLMFPDRSWMLNLNDHGFMLPQGMPYLLLTARRYDRPQDYAFWYEFEGPDHPLRPYGDLTRWRETHVPSLTHVATGRMPTQALTFLWGDVLETAPRPLESFGLPTADYSPGTENASFRTSWGRDAIYLNIAGGGRSHASHGHAHADCGHFSLFAHGEYLAIDTARYNADEDQHNVPLIDGRCYLPHEGWGSSHRTGSLRDFQAGDWVDHVTADAAHIKNCVWADRHVLFVRLGGDDAYVVLVDDVNADNGTHRYWWQLHTCPEHKIVLDQAGSAARIEAARARLDMTFVLPRDEDFPKTPHRLALRTDEKEWGYGGPPAKTHLAAHLILTSARRPRLIAEFDGMMLSVLVPRHSDQVPLAVRPVPGRRLLCAEVAWVGGTDTVVAALAHGWIDLPGIRGQAELAVVRRDLQGRVVAQWTSNGSRLATGMEDKWKDLRLH